MLAFNSLIDRLNTNLPEFVRPTDLVKTGLFSAPYLTRARREGKMPPFIKKGSKVLFLKQDVLEWLRGMYRETERENNS